MTHPVFNTHSSETQMMRYIRRLEKKDIGLDTAMIPLGSCTMKLNAAAEMLPITWPEFSKLHPFAPVEQAAGYRQVIEELASALCAVTGFAAVSLQPNSGAQGEFAGLLVINAYHQSRGEAHRNVVLIPQSAHGTNPASAAMVGLKVVVVATDEQGNVRMEDLRSKAEGHRDQSVVPDGDVSEHARRVRRRHSRDVRDRSRERRPGVHGWREHERAGGTDQSRGHRRRCVSSQPAQDVRHSARRRWPRHGARSAWPRIWRRSFLVTRW